MRPEQVWLLLGAIYMAPLLPKWSLWLLGSANLTMYLYVMRLKGFL